LTCYIFHYYYTSSSSSSSSDHHQSHALLVVSWIEPIHTSIDLLIALFLRHGVQENTHGHGQKEQTESA
jgi:hypothetical protein